MTTRIAVIGAGPGGYIAAVRAAQLGAEVALIEKEAVGGTCLHWGCIPSKIMKKTADLLHHYTVAADYGIDISGSVTLNLAKLMARKAKIIQTQVKGIEALLKHHGITAVYGVGRIAAPGLLQVETTNGEKKEIAWDRLIIATGTVPAALPGIDFDQDRILSSNDILSLAELPASMVIVGAGVIGCEFACILSAMGCAVTLVEALDRVLPLPSVDAGCSKLLLRELKKRNVKVLLSHTVRQIETVDDRMSITAAPLEGNGKVQKLSADKMLVCIGRKPAMSGLGLENIGVHLDDRGWILVDDHLQTSAEGVYAIGDILGPGKIMLAHVASSEGLAAADNAMGATRTVQYHAVPSAIFTSPEVATVGLSEAQALEQGHTIGSETVLFRVVGKAQVMGELAGEVKIVFEKAGGRVLGVHMTGPHVTELIAEAALAVTQNLTVQQIAGTIHAHPTLAEIMGEAAMKAAGRALHG